jgi:hypothetical protein
MSRWSTCLGIATVDRLVVALHWDDASGKQTAQYIEAASRKGAGGVAAPRDEGQARRRKIQKSRAKRRRGGGIGFHLETWALLGRVSPTRFRSFLTIHGLDWTCARRTLYAPAECTKLILAVLIDLVIPSLSKPLFLLCFNYIIDRFQG